jgi:hypothetical protein
MLKKLLILSTIAMAVNAYSYAKTRIVTMGVPMMVKTHITVPVSAELEYGIQNNTFDPQFYIVSYFLCPENKDCYRNSFPVYLASTERIQKIISVGLPVTYHHQANFRIVTGIQINGESSDQSEGVGHMSVTG